MAKKDLFTFEPHIVPASPGIFLLKWSEPNEKWESSIVAYPVIAWRFANGDESGSWDGELLPIPIVRDVNDCYGRRDATLYIEFPGGLITCDDDRDYNSRTEFSEEMLKRWKEKQQQKETA